MAKPNITIVIETSDADPEEGVSLHIKGFDAGGNPVALSTLPYNILVATGRALDGIKGGRFSEDEVAQIAAQNDGPLN